MKKIIVLMLLSASSAQAGEINCFLNGFYSRAKVQWDKEFVSVTIHNPRGFKAMPQMESPMSEDMIPMLKMQSENLAALGSRFEYKWPRSQCKWAANDQRLLSCEGAANSVGEDNQIQARIFTTARVDEDSLSGAFSRLRFRFIFKSQGLYFVAIPFPADFCKLKED
jgi:hypothetical protein